MRRPDPDALVDAICELGHEIARACPDCAEKAKRLVGLVAQLRPAPLDRVAVQDAIEAQVAGSDVSDAGIMEATEAVMRANRDEEG